jgi:hypothetical protein
LWRRRSAFTRGITAYRRSRAVQALEAFERALEKHKNGASDFAAAADYLRDLIKAVANLLVGFMFLMLLAITSPVVNDMRFVIGAVLAMFMNVFFDVLQFARRAYALLGAIDGIYRPELYLEYHRVRVNRFRTDEP